ncbi:MAG: hypothetical protein JXA72_12065 [Bacteroidales bacterium]|nr:hypothetical protein [Bacteroidales bacterium]
MTKYEIWSLLLNTLIAVGLFGVVILALFGDWIRNKIFPAQLDIEILDKNGELTIMDNGHKVIYYHIHVVNKKSVVVKNCMLFLKSIQKLEAGGSFVDIPVSVPPRYVWSPAETTPEAVDIIKSHIADFGYVIDSSTDFKPTVTPILNSFRGNLEHHETFRYYIQIVSENYNPKHLFGIEVTWDGQWPENLKEMYKHLVIKRI